MDIMHMFLDYLCKVYTHDLEHYIKEYLKTFFLYSGCVNTLQEHYGYYSLKLFISIHSVFPLVYVWVRQMGYWKVLQYFSDAKICIFILFLPIWPKFGISGHNSAVMTVLAPSATSVSSPYY